MTTTLNADPAEIHKFEILASRWWDKESEFKPLHEINPLRLQYINQIAPLENKKVLDIGCGGGILSESMAKLGAKVTGIDLGEAPLEVAKLHLLESGQDVDYQKISAEEMAEQHPQKFDVITCMEMLEHVPDPESIIKACSKLVKPNGYVFFSTINRSPKSYLFAIIGAEYILNMLPKGTHDYDKFIRPSELIHWTREADLMRKNITGLIYNPLTKNYSLDPHNVSVNYMVATQLIG